jgi:hypothetical protein
VWHPSKGSLQDHGRAAGGVVTGYLACRCQARAARARRPARLRARRGQGRRRTLIGAVVNGPNDRSLFSDGQFFDEGRDCHTGGYGAFTGHGSRFVDDVRSWQTVEPAIDFTATAALAFALTG